MLSPVTRLSAYLNPTGRHKKLAGGSLLLFAIAWSLQAVLLATILYAGLTGNSSLPTFGSRYGLWMWVGVAAAAAGLLLVSIGFYTVDYSRHCHLIARVCGWQAAIGSVLVFSVAVSDLESATRDGSVTVGLYLLMPALIGIAATLLAEMWDHRKRQDDRSELAAEIADRIARRLSSGTTAVISLDGEGGLPRTGPTRVTMAIVAAILFSRWLVSKRRPSR
jgi:hypothetical protein